MEFCEHNIFEDIPGKGKSGKFHSAILMSYSIELIPFEHQLLSALHRHEISSVNLLLDANQFDQAMTFMTPDSLKNIGREYAVSIIPSKGAFHPKINFFVGDENILVIFGSGNLTIGGQGKNHETFTGLMVDSKKQDQLPLILECWDYVTYYVEKYCNNEVKRRILKEIPTYCKWLPKGQKALVIRHSWLRIDNGLEAALLYNDESSCIIRQIRSLLPADKVRKISIVSPFYDECGDTLLNLSEIFPNCKEIDVFMQTTCRMPPNSIKDSKIINFYDFDQTNRGQEKLKQFHRNLHSKLFWFESLDEEYLVVGSANATVAAIGSITQPNINDEFCICYKGGKQNFLEELGIINKKELPVLVKDMKREPQEGKGDSSDFRIHLRDASYVAGELKVQVEEGTKGLKINLLLLQNKEQQESVRDIEFDNSRIFRTKINIQKTSTICVLTDANGAQISNRLFLHWPNELESTNPSSNNRKINRIIAELEAKNYDASSFMDKVTNLLLDVPSEEEPSISRKVSSTDDKVKNKNSELPTLVYDPENEKSNNEKSRFFGHHEDSSFSRLFECVINSIRFNSYRNEDGHSEEEEDACAETSHQRDSDVFAESQQDNRLAELTRKAEKELEKEHKPMTPSNIYEKMAELIHLQFQQLIRSINKMIGAWNQYINSRNDNLAHNQELKICRKDFSIASIVMLIVTQLCQLKKLQEYSVDDEKSLVKNLMNYTFQMLGTLALFLDFWKERGIDEDVVKSDATDMICMAFLMGEVTLNVMDLEQKNYAECALHLSLCALLRTIGIPDNDKIHNYLDPLSNDCNYEFRTEEVILLIEELEARMNSGEFCIFNGYWCAKRLGKKPLYLEDCIKKIGGRR